MNQERLPILPVPSSATSGQLTALKRCCRNDLSTGSTWVDRAGYLPQHH
jgi:hypothetical protein